MRKKKILTIAIAIVAIILLALVIMTTFNFQKEKTNVFEDLTNEPEKETVFSNSSDMSEQDIRLLVEEKRITLKNIIENVKYYTLSEISSNYSKTDDEEYIGIDDNFLNDLSKLLTSELMDEIRNTLTMVEIDSNVLLETTVYKCSKTLFDNLSYDSAIAFNDVNDEQLILKSATNEKIEAIEKIKLCDEENPDVCERESEYELILVKENNEWKISEFGQKII